MMKSAATGQGTFGHCRDGSDVLDGDIGLLIGGYDLIRYGRRLTGVRAGHEEDIPWYSRSMAAAETLWLPDAGPRGRRPMPSAVACCLAALCDRWGLMRRPRPRTGKCAAGGSTRNPAPAASAWPVLPVKPRGTGRPLWVRIADAPVEQLLRMQDGKVRDLFGGQSVHTELQGDRHR
ncbi:hypothetical protein [Cupriavidus sp. TMH.W2]|uniref:hypothetical protein n=1 Tax=Cupriavidus sp. TMH.W2 TaxID=3434465 RepID=UPI003D7717A7